MPSQQFTDAFNALVHAVHIGNSSPIVAEGCLNELEARAGLLGHCVLLVCCDGTQLNLGGGRETWGTRCKLGGWVKIR